LAERDLIQFLVDYSKKFINWLRTNGVVSMTTVAIDTAEQWISGLTSNNVSSAGQQMSGNDCGPVSVTSFKHVL